MKALLKNVVGAVAPTLGTALGGLASAVISFYFGASNSTKD